MNVNKKRISTSFQKWLLLIVGIAFAVTLAFLGGYQTKLFTDSAESLLDVYIKDVRQDIYDTADRNLLTLARAAANEVNSQGEVSDEFLRGMLDRYKLSEINIVNSEGIIIVSTDTRLVGYDLKSAGLQSAEFLALLGAMPGSALPAASRTALKALYSGNKLSMQLNTASYKATSIT